jgi:hypothetical protein
MIEEQLKFNFEDGYTPINIPEKIVARLNKIHNGEKASVENDFFELDLIKEPLPEPYEDDGFDPRPLSFNEFSLKRKREGMANSKVFVNKVELKDAKPINYVNREAAKPFYQRANVSKLAERHANPDQKSEFDFARSNYKNKDKHIAEPDSVLRRSDLKPLISVMQATLLEIDDLKSQLKKPNTFRRFIKSGLKWLESKI